MIFSWIKLLSYLYNYSPLHISSYPLSPVLYGPSKKLEFAPAECHGCHSQKSPCSFLRSMTSGIIYVSLYLRVKSFLATVHDGQTDGWTDNHNLIISIGTSWSVGPIGPPLSQRKGGVAYYFYPCLYRICSWKIWWEIKFGGVAVWHSNG